ncbi:MAG: hypothetical protein IJ225_00205 [Solobacterium sp.]|nr:hypothetical protein [Solobacterium sp.]
MKQIKKQAILTAVVTAAVSMGTVFTLSNRVEKTSAYFTDSEHHVNSYTFGDITIDGTETDWNPEDAKFMVPREITSKNPRIENTGTNLAVGFIVVDSPILKNVTLSDDNGKLKPAADVEEFRFLNAEKNEGFNTNTWTLIDSQYINASGETLASAMTPSASTPAGTAFRRYVFGCKNAIEGGSAEAPVKTEPLFNYIQAQNFVEGTFRTGEGNGIDVKFLAVQAENLTLPDGTITTAENTKNMNASRLLAIYRIAAARADFSDLPEADTSNHLNLNAEKLS